MFRQPDIQTFIKSAPTSKINIMLPSVDEKLHFLSIFFLSEVKTKNTEDIARVKSAVWPQGR